MPYDVESIKIKIKIKIKIHYFIKHIWTPSFEDN
jgi:hypothetical protein